MTSRQNEIIDAVIAQLKLGIGTASATEIKIADGSFYKRKVPWLTKEMVFPSVIVVPVTQKERPLTNVATDIGYGVQVVIVDQSTESNRKTTDIDRIGTWREQAQFEFRSKRLQLAETVCHTVEIEPGPYFDLAAFANMRDATAFVIRCWVRELHRVCV